MTARVWLQVMVCILVASSATLCCCCCGEFSYTTEPSDLAGIWRASYDEHDFEFSCGIIVTGVETLTLRADGTYQQVYADGRGYVYTSPWQTWYSDYRSGSEIIHLQGGRFYPLGIERAEGLAEGTAYYHDSNVWGEPLELDGKEAVLRVTSNYYIFQDTHEVTLEYPPVCVPDHDIRVRFYRVSK